MPEISLVERAERSPTGCLICGRQDGPFIDAKISTIQFWTANGVQVTNTAVYLCVGNEDNPGCVVQMGRRSGLLVEERLFRDVVEINASLTSEVAELRSSLAKKTVSVQSLIDAGVVVTGGQYVPSPPVDEIPAVVSDHPETVVA